MLRCFLLILASVMALGAAEVRFGVEQVVISEVDQSTRGVPLTQTVPVVLSEAPPDNVTVEIDTRSLPAYLSVSPTTFAFDPQNWNTPQQLAISGADNGVQDGDHAFTLNVQDAGQSFIGSLPIQVLDEVPELSIESVQNGVFATPNAREVGWVVRRRGPPGPALTVQLRFLTPTSDVPELADPVFLRYDGAVLGTDFTPGAGLVFNSVAGVYEATIPSGQELLEISAVPLDVPASDRSRIILARIEPSPSEAYVRSPFPQQSPFVAGGLIYGQAFTPTDLTLRFTGQQTVIDGSETARGARTSFQVVYSAPLGRLINTATFTLPGNVQLPARILTTETSTIDGQSLVTPMMLSSFATRGSAISSFERET
jgi:hypothetical protein